MNRKDTTKLLTDILISDKLSDRKYYAKEVTLDYGTNSQKRVDVMQFSPKGVIHTSSIEKGTFTCYEIKSCIEDVYSGYGLNFFGERNYIVTTLKTYHGLQHDLNCGQLKVYIQNTFPESSLNFGVMVAVPRGINLKDTDALFKEYLNPTPLNGDTDNWRLWTVIQCLEGNRNRSMTELLFCMLRSKHNYANVSR